jgi:hypothetical protein
MVEREFIMSQETDKLLAEVTQEIDSKDIEQASATNKRVDAAYGAGGRGLIVPVQVMTPAKSEDLY